MIVSVSSVRVAHRVPHVESQFPARHYQSGFIPVSVDDGHLLTESGHLIRLRNKTFLVPLDYLQQLTSSGIYLLVLDSLTFHLVQFYAR